MRQLAQKSYLILLVLLGALALPLTSSTTVLMKLLAATGATVLIMGGTGNPLSTPPSTATYVEQYMGRAVDQYVSPASTATPSTGIPNGPYNTVAVITPEEWWPGTGELTLNQSLALGQQNLDNCIKGTSCDYNDQVGSVAPAPGDTFVVYGFSQSSTIATLEKRSLTAQYAPGQGPDVSFVLIANGNRPNGGFLARGPKGVTVPSFLPFGGATFNGSTPTNTQYDTVDVAAQYDGWSDFPVNPLNPLAVMNAMMGVDYLHLGGTYDHTTLTNSDVIDQGRYGDTHYYLISTPVLPLLMPLDRVPVVGHPLADTLDAPLRVIVESAYDRTTSPGVPTSWNTAYFPNPAKFARNLAVSIPTGLDNGIQDVLGVRPFGTTRPGPFGVGGPGVTYTAPGTTSATKKSGGGFNPRAVKAAIPPVKIPAAKRATAAAANDTKSGSSSDSDSSSKPSTSTTPKHSGLGSSKRAKAAASS